MPSPFQELLACLHRSPCWRCRETGHCHSPVLRHLMEHSQRLAAWARGEPGVGEGELRLLARDYATEVDRAAPACRGIAPSGGGSEGRHRSGRIRADEPAGPASPAEPL